MDRYLWLFAQIFLMLFICVRMFLDHGEVQPAWVLDAPLMIRAAFIILGVPFFFGYLFGKNE